MRMLTITVMAGLGLGGCVQSRFNQLPEPRDCETRHAYYPDEDGDGIGEPTTVVIACKPPEGYVTELGPTEPPEPADPTGDTGAP